MAYFQREADAARCVEAVNEVGKLREALRAALEQFRKFNSGDGVYHTDTLALEEQIYDALEDDG